MRRNSVDTMATLVEAEPSDFALHIFPSSKSRIPQATPSVLTWTQHLLARFVGDSGPH